MIIVTGGAGFIGSALIWQLNREGRRDILVVDRLGDGGKWRNLSPLAFAGFMDKQDFQAGLADDPLRTLPADCEVVFHLGACSSTTERDADYLIRNNSQTTLHLARACDHRGIPLVYASSAATYGDGALGFDDDPGQLESLRPLNGYGWSKQLADRWLAQERLLVYATGFRFFNVFGPNEYHKGPMRSMVLKAWQQIRAGEGASLFANHRPGFADGDESRDFVYVKDVVETLLATWRQGGPGGLYNLGTGTARSFRDLVLAVYGALGLEPDIRWVPMPEELRGQYQYYTRASMERCRYVGLPVPCTPLEEAVRDYVCNYLEKGQACLGASAADSNL